MALCGSLSFSSSRAVTTLPSLSSASASLALQAIYMSYTATRVRTGRQNHSQFLTSRQEFCQQLLRGVPEDFLALATNPPLQLQ